MHTHTRVRIALHCDLDPLAKTFSCLDMSQGVAGPFNRNRCILAGICIGIGELGVCRRRPDISHELVRIHGLGSKDGGRVKVGLGGSLCASAPR